MSTAAGLGKGSPVWPRRERLEAQCLALARCGARSPNPRHACGIYAYKELKEAQRWASAVAWRRPVAVGEVWLWGTVVEAERGWRARYAYPARLMQVIPPRSRDQVDPFLINDLACAYGISVTELASPTPPVTGMRAVVARLLAAVLP